MPATATRSTPPDLHSCAKNPVCSGAFEGAKNRAGAIEALVVLRQAVGQMGQAKTWKMCAYHAK
jgi:hypothetical protein